MIAVLIVLMLMCSYASSPYVHPYEAGTLLEYLSENRVREELHKADRADPGRKGV